MIAKANGRGALRRYLRRGIAQPGSAEVLGTSGRRFKSCCPDQKKTDAAVATAAYEFNQREAI